VSRRARPGAAPRSSGFSTRGAMVATISHSSAKPVSNLALGVHDLVCDIDCRAYGLIPGCRLAEFGDSSAVTAPGVRCAPAERTWKMAPITNSKDFIENGESDAKSPAAPLPIDELIDPAKTDAVSAASNITQSDSSMVGRDPDRSRLIIKVRSTTMRRSRRHPARLRPQAISPSS
jgi:hypothetical protein